MADFRSKADKLRSLYHHPRTSVIEREAARLALERMNEPLVKKVNFNHSQPPPPRPTYPRYPRGASPFAGVFWDDLMRATRGANSAFTGFADAQRRFDEAVQEQLRQQAAAVAERLRKEEEERRRAAIPPCPGCHHPESAHVSFRCYSCGHTPPGTDVRRAQWCGWMWADKKDGSGEWVKAVSSWQ